MKKIIADIIEALEGVGSQERRELSEYYFPTKMRVIGSTNPDSKIVLKGLKESNANFTPADWIELAIELVRTDVFECQGIAYELIGKNRKLWPLITTKDILKLKRNLDNWASVDGFGIYVTGIQWRLGTITDGWVANLLQSDDHWERRLAVVSTVALNLKSRGGTGDAIRTIWVCEQVIDDRQDMVVKALSWALRELSKRDPEIVTGFLKTHENRLANRVIREVSHKLEFGTKN